MQVRIQGKIRMREFLETRGGKAVRHEDPFCRGFVQRVGQAGDLSAGIGNPHHFQDRRDLGFARIAPVALAGVEADIDLQPLQPPEQIRIPINPGDVMPRFAQGGGIGGDVGFAVEFGERVRRVFSVGGRVFL